MGNYTAEQVAMAFRAGFIEAAKWPSVCTQDADSEAVYEAADAYAATLRQQAFSQFANPEALADWLDALHECHADGSVGNRKWEAAQVAARAIRSLNEPSGNSGQLRQQAGRVDEGRGEALFYVQDRPVYRGDKLLHPDTYATGRNVTAEFRAKGDTVTVRTENGAVPTVRVSDLSWPTAALAQNTQGDGVLCPSCGYRVSYGAERARVPEFCDENLPDYGLACEARGWNKAIRTMLAAAPSQRAEVK